MYESDSDEESTLEPSAKDRDSVAASSKEPCTQKNVVGSVYGKFSGDFPNDGVSGEFSRSDYRHSNELNQVNICRVNVSVVILKRVLHF